MSKNIVVKVKRTTYEVKVQCGEDVFTFYWLGSEAPKFELWDFAVWLSLPIAMARNSNIHIAGKGAYSTKKNAEKLSDIWSGLLPKIYSPVYVTFDEYFAAEEVALKKYNPGNKDIMFFSGGVDSTYALLQRNDLGLSQDLLTLQGMDYKSNEDERFSEFRSKTDYFAKKLCNERYYVKTDAYDVYKQYDLNGQMSHIFLLSAVGFMYYTHYNHCVVSADFTPAQQISCFPVGSTFATNHYISSGYYALKTVGEDVTRCNKLPLIISDSDALRSLSFCKNYHFRPENCGECSKCVRTKLMFLASTGFIPEGVFYNSTISGDGLHYSFSRHKSMNFSLIHDLYVTALRSGTLIKLPGLEESYLAGNKGKKKSIKEIIERLL